MPKLKIEVVTPGFDLDFWSGKEVQLQEFSEVGLQQRYKPYILSVGALKPRKGYHNSIRAFAAVAKKIDGLNYIIIGQGEDSDYAKKLKDIVKENGLEKRVFFISSGIDLVRSQTPMASDDAQAHQTSNGIDDIALLGFYRNAELFILTPVEENNHFEGFGIVYLEAAASGLPIVATCNSGATSAISEGYNGLFVVQNDSEATANAILKILENPELKIKLGDNGKEWVKEFSWEKIIKKYIEIYDAKHY